MKSIFTDSFEVYLEGDTGSFETNLVFTKDADGIEYVKLSIVSETEALPKPIKLWWRMPAVDIFGTWSPNIGFGRRIMPDWHCELKSKSTSGAPVISLFNINGRNRHTFAFSDALNVVSLRAGVREEDAQYYCSITLFEEQVFPVKKYEATLRLDGRDVPYYESLSKVSKWWESLEGYKPTFAPEYARLPMYSTWYSFHQRTIPDEIVEQCRLSKELGCEAVIVDDGWQTMDNHRGYAYCGDWEVAEGKIPDMKDFVSKVHDLGMKFLLWYSVPFVGKHTKAWDRFMGKFLNSEENEWCTLDPRFSEVREYLINIYENAVKDWDLDGLKLDFVDSFNITEHSSNKKGDGRDYDSLAEAVDRLLKDVLERLKDIKPDIMIEFRQSYIGSLMRTYGNMFRSGDCPNCSLTNRVHTVDIRLICGDTAAHADMVMWSGKDTVENAALQIINVLFSVPQVSVMIDGIPEDHKRMLKFYLGFWKENRDVLLDGEFCPENPGMLYPVVKAFTDEKMVAAVYSNCVLKLEDELRDVSYIVNGTGEDILYLDFKKDFGQRDIKVYNCCGELVKEDKLQLKGLMSIDVPESGMVKIQ